MQKKQFTEYDGSSDSVPLMSLLRVVYTIYNIYIYDIINHIIYTLSVIMSLLYKFAAAIVLVTTA